MSKELSEKIASFYTKDKAHFVTIASWKSIWGPTFEVGLRDLKTGDFVLAASHLQSEVKARSAAKAIGKLAEAGESLKDIESAFPGLFD